MALRTSGVIDTQNIGKEDRRANATLAGLSGAFDDVRSVRGKPNSYANFINKSLGDPISSNYLSGQANKIAGQGLVDLGFKETGTALADMNLGAALKGLGDSTLAGLSELSSVGSTVGSAIGSGIGAIGPTLGSVGSAASAAGTGLMSSLGNLIALIL